VTTNVTFTVPARGVLSNDTDTDANAFTAILATMPAHGGVVLNADGSFTYTPVPGYSGPDTFTLDRPRQVVTTESRLPPANLVPCNRTHVNRVPHHAPFDQ
jgi:hypothetical protein